MWHLISLHEYKEWLGYDLSWLERCDALVRLPGESNGADGEVNRALALWLPVFESVDELIANY